MLASSDVTIISLVEGMYGLSVPSRMYNVMAAGVPIVAISDPRSELALTVTEAGAGWVLTDRKPEALATLVERLADDGSRSEVRRRGDAGRRTVVERFTLPVILDAYRTLLR